MRTPKASVEVSESTLTFTFTNGKQLVASLDEVEPLLKRLALHGLEQKLRDSYAGVQDVEEAYQTAVAVWETLQSGEWGKRRESGPREEPIDLLVKALEAVLQRKKKPVPADLREKVSSLDRSARAKLRAVPEVAAEVARLKGGSTDTLSSVLGL